MEPQENNLKGIWTHEDPEDNQAYINALRDNLTKLKEQRILLARNLQLTDKTIEYIEKTLSNAN